MASTAIPTDADARAVGAGQATLLGILVAVCLSAVLYPWFIGRSGLREGAHAPWTLTAPRAVSYDSVARTEQVRTEAANAVPDVLVLDPGVRDRALAELDRQLNVIQQFRSDTGLSMSAREGAIRIVPGQLSTVAASTLATAASAEWEAIAADARTALGRTLSGTLRDADLGAARQRATTYFSPGLTAAQAQAVAELINPLVVPTLVVDGQRTAALRGEARRSQPPVHVSHARGDVLVSEGQPLTAADIELLERAGLWTSGARGWDIAGAALMAVLAGTAVAGYLAVARPRALRGWRERWVLLGLLILPALIAKVALPLLLPDHQRHFVAYALPLAAGPVLAAALLDLGSAMLLSILVATVAAFVAAYAPLSQGDAMAGLDTVRMWLAVASGSIGGVLCAAAAQRPQRYLLAGAVTAGGTAAALLLVWLIDANRALRDPGWIMVSSVACGVLAAGIVLMAFALVRRPLGIITRVELMELTQLSNPLLRRLQDEAPGTFQHSIVVGNLAERAAERIGADALLVRIGAYYHDIGKLSAPPFFVENSGESNPHDALDPAQSTRVILGHVHAGIEIARDAKLPEPVVAFIPQHHGTRLVTFFYRRAAAADPNVDPELFRYPGPRPQSREAALVMLADASEATVRASADRSPEHIRELVESLIRERVEEGQFDECDLSLRDLRTVADSYVATLNAVYHPRIEYPEPTARELAGRRATPALGPPAGRAAPLTLGAPRGPFDELDEDTR